MQCFDASKTPELEGVLVCSFLDGPGYSKFALSGLLLGSTMTPKVAIINVCSGPAGTGLNSAGFRVEFCGVSGWILQGFGMDSAGFQAEFCWAWDRFC